MVIRLAEMEGKETIVQLKVPVTVSKARRLNLIELPLGIVPEPTSSGNMIQFKIRAHEIVTLGILPK